MTKPENPTISVLMPVYNAERYLREAVDSVLGQTFTDFELIAVDDGSTDGSLAILRDYERRDPRVRVISRPNTGYVVALNEMLALARGEFIARMDADDVCLPERFAEQVHELTNRSDVVATSCWVLKMDEDGDPLMYFRSPVTHQEIDSSHLVDGVAAMCHSGLLARKRVFDEIDGYRVEMQPAEDIDLYLRLAEIGRLSCVPKVLLRYRNHAKSVSHTNSMLQGKKARVAQRDAFIRRGLEVRGICGDDSSAADSGASADYQWQLVQKWAWWGWFGGFPGTARKYAWRAVQSRPLSWKAWKLVLVTHLKRPPEAAV